MYANCVEVKIKKDQSFEYIIPGYETCIVPATGTIDVNVEGENYNSIGKRSKDVWDGEPEGVYTPTNIKASQFRLCSDRNFYWFSCKYFIATATPPF